MPALSPFSIRLISSEHAMFRLFKPKHPAPCVSPYSPHVGDVLERGARRLIINELPDLTGVHEYEEPRIEAYVYEQNYNGTWPTVHEDVRRITPSAAALLFHDGWTLILHGSVLFPQP